MELPPPEQDPNASERQFGEYSPEEITAAWWDPDLRAAASIETGELDYEELFVRMKHKLAQDAFDASGAESEDDPAYRRLLRAREDLTAYQQRHQPPQP